MAYTNCFKSFLSRLEKNQAMQQLMMLSKYQVNAQEIAPFFCS
jgi:hypothetical protein